MGRVNVPWLGTPSKDVPKQINDSTTVVSELMAEHAVTISDVNIRLTLDHPSISELDVFLVSPTGTRVELFSDLADTGANFQSTVFDDEASDSISTGTAPYVGSFRPLGTLSDFDGEFAYGIWKLEVTDDTGGNVGTIKNWSLIFNTSAGAGSGGLATLDTPVEVSEVVPPVLSDTLLDQSVDEHVAPNYGLQHDSASQRDLLLLALYGDDVSSGEEESLDHWRAFGESDTTAEQLDTRLLDLAFSDLPHLA